MIKLNLKELYPFYYTEDSYIEVSDEVAEQIKAADRYEHACFERARVNRAYYSLDVGDGIKEHIIFKQMTPQEIYERKVTNAEIYAAINALPEKQAKRIYAHFFQGISMAEMARIEKVDRQSVHESISRGLKNISKILKNF